jgi:hypothetical protein
VGFWPSTMHVRVGRPCFFERRRRRRRRETTGARGRLTVQTTLQGTVASPGHEEMGMGASVCLCVIRIWAQGTGRLMKSCFHRTFRDAAFRAVLLPLSVARPICSQPTSDSPSSSNQPDQQLRRLSRLDGWRTNASRFLCISGG